MPPLIMYRIRRGDSMMGIDVARGIVRRDFLKLAGAASVSGLARSAFAASGGRVCLILDPEDAAASSGPAKRAMGELRRELEAKASCAKRRRRLERQRLWLC
jgi:hypothetical protein